MLVLDILNNFTTTLYYYGVILTSVTGLGINLYADITIQNGVNIPLTISNGGVGYRVADVLRPITVGTGGLGAGIELSVSNIQGENQLELTDVQGTFGTGLLRFCPSSIVQVYPQPSTQLLVQMLFLQMLLRLSVVMTSESSKETTECILM